MWRRAILRVGAVHARVHGRPPVLLRPRRFTDKMQWRKLFDRNPAFAVLCDKLAVRDHIAARVGAGLLTPLLWSGEADAIPFDTVAPPYALKSSHASGQVAMVAAGEVPDRARLRALAAAWLRTPHGIDYDEPGYVGIPPRLMMERTVTAPDGSAPEEVRLFVFDGRVAVINTVFTQDGRIRNGAFHTRDWVRLDWHLSRRVERPFPPPARLHEMIAIAERLGAGLDHVRVDIYDGGPRIWVGEITVYAWSGHATFHPAEADLLLGAHWRLRRPMLRAARAILFGSRPE